MAAAIRHHMVLYLVMVANAESVNFDRAAGYYDATRALPDEAMAELLGVLVPELAARGPCLEIGIGTGRIALPLHDQGISMAGADIAEAMLRRLVVNAEGAAPFPLLLADARRLPLAAGSFGSVLAVHVLHLIPTWQEAVDEAVRVLRPGGALIASFPGGEAATRQQVRMAAWRPAVREALARHGVVRVRSGAHAPQDVGAYLGDIAPARLLPPVAVPEPQPLYGTLGDLAGLLLLAVLAGAGSRRWRRHPRLGARRSVWLMSTSSWAPWSGGRSTSQGDASGVKCAG
jgi:SAM-dependent methyltransferase